MRRKLLALLAVIMLIPALSSAQHATVLKRNSNGTITSVITLPAKKGQSYDLMDHSTEWKRQSLPAADADDSIRIQYTGFNRLVKLTYLPVGKAFNPLWKNLTYYYHPDAATHVLYFGLVDGYDIPPENFQPILPGTYGGEYARYEVIGDSIIIYNNFANMAEVPEQRFIICSGSQDGDQTWVKLPATNINNWGWDYIMLPLDGVFDTDEAGNKQYGVLRWNYGGITADGKQIGPVGQEKDILFVAEGDPTLHQGNFFATVYKK